MKILFRLIQIVFSYIFEYTFQKSSSFNVLLSYRVTEEVEENKMTASNLGIIFGPTLIRPRQTDATISLSSLVDYPYQARIVELLITYYDKIFDVSREMVNPEKLVLADDREPQQIRKSQSLPVGNEVGLLYFNNFK